MCVQAAEPVLVSKAMAVEVCELVSAEVVSVPRMLVVDPVEVDSVSGVVDYPRTVCVSNHGGRE